VTAPAGRYPTRFDDRGPTATIAPPLEQTDEDLALLERFERDWSIACELRPAGLGGAPCGASASWWLICRECGNAIAWCEPHRAEQTAALASWVALVITAACDRCGATVRAPLWRHLFLVEPIGRRS
jgi:hypothetical protein